MPVMDGYTATSRIRQQARFATLPIIAMTANAMTGDRERVLACGMNDHIAKPLHVTTMFATLAKWIKPSTTRQVMLGTEPTTPISSGLPTTLEGIDQTAGLATCQGRTELYLRLLRKFLTTNQEFTKQFESALGNADPTAATRLSHSLCGTAGNIGALKVSQAAAELERRCQSGGTGEQIKAALVEVELRLIPVLGALAKLGEEHVSPQQLAQTSNADLQQRLAKLGRLLAESDIQAVDTLLELQNLALGPELTERLAKVARQIERFDFDTALALLES